MTPSATEDADIDPTSGPTTTTAPRTSSTRGPTSPRSSRSSGSSRWPPSIADAVGLAFVVGGFCLGLRPFFDNSLFTHIATGRLIVESGIPHQDPYSFTALGAPWVVQSWFVSLVYGLVERSLGVVGLRVLSGVLVAILFGLVWRLTHTARTLFPRIVITGLFVTACSPFLPPRPLLLGLVMLGLALVVVTEHHDARWLIPIFWVWTNSHGSFPLGLVALGCLALGTRLDGDRDRRVWHPLAWAVGGTVLAVVNPLGPALLTFPIALLGKMDILSRVIEWQSPSFANGFARIFLLQIVVAVLALIRRPSYRVAIPLVVFAAAALLGQRNIPDASLVIVPGLALCLADLGNVDGRERGAVPVVLGVVLLLFGAFAASNQLAQPAFDLSSYPTDAISWMAQRDLIGPEHHVATEDTVGNTLELLYGTRAGVFFDDRYDMYPTDLANDYIRVHEGSPGWEAALDRHGVQYLLWSRASPVSQLVAGSDHWRVLYQDSHAFVACRRGSGAPDC